MPLVLEMFLSTSTHPSRETKNLESKARQFLIYVQTQTRCHLGPLPVGLFGCLFGSRCVKFNQKKIDQNFDSRTVLKTDLQGLVESRKNLFLPCFFSHCLTCFFRIGAIGFKNPSLRW